MSIATFRRTKPETGFEHSDQAQQRLLNTVVMYKGEGYYLTTIENRVAGLSANIAKLPCNFTSHRGKNPPTTRKLLSDPLFNKFRPFDLGFVNLFDGPCEGNQNCLFTYRRPLRSGARQGLTREAIDGRYVQSTRGGRLEGWDLVNQLMLCQSFADMLAGKYPSYSECVDNLIQNSSIAFDRFYCVSMDADGLMWLHRHTERVGMIDYPSREILLFSNKKYLREEIQENPSMPPIKSEI